MNLLQNNAVIYLNLEKTKGLWNIHNRKGTNKHGPVRKRCIKVWLAKAK